MNTKMRSEIEYGKRCIAFVEELAKANTDQPEWKLAVVIDYARKCRHTKPTVIKRCSLKREPLT